MLENNTNNIIENLIKQNKTCHLQCDQIHYYQNMST
jgi:hypothetical protein